MSAMAEKLSGNDEERFDVHGNQLRMGTNPCCRLEHFRHKR